MMGNTDIGKSQGYLHHKGRTFSGYVSFHIPAGWLLFEDVDQYDA